MTNSNISWLTAESIPSLWGVSIFDVTDDNDKKDFESWKEHWNAYRNLTGLEYEPPETQVSVLKFCMAVSTLKVINNFDLNAAQKKHPDGILKALTSYIRRLS